MPAKPARENQVPPGVPPPDPPVIKLSRADLNVTINAAVAAAFDNARNPSRKQLAALEEAHVSDEHDPATDNEATDFIRSLKSAILNDKVLRFKCDRHVARAMGLNTFDLKIGSVCILIRDEYEDLWRKISSRGQQDEMTSANTVIVGTAGIGKSLFRWYLVWKWMQDDPDLNQFGFEDIRINISEDFWAIQKNGMARPIAKHLVNRTASSSLGLLDPCSLLQGHSFRFRMLIVTSSPSCVVGQKEGLSLTQFRKMAVLYVMTRWTLDELRMIKPNLDPDQIEKFSSTEGTIVYCVPRWFFYEQQEIEGQIAESWINISKDALRDFFLKHKDDESKSKDLPYRLCAIAENNYNNWKVVGFISNFAAKAVYRWAEIGAHLDRAGFLNLLEHPLGASLIGNWFERWALESLQRQEGILVSRAQLGPLKAARGAAHSTEKFVFKALEIIDIDLPRRGKPKYTIKLEAGTVYKPKSKIFPSIDAYGKTESGDLIFMQFTKSLTHSPASWNDLSSIAKEAQRHEIKRMILIYCCPSVEEFRVPECPDVSAKNVIVSKGRLESEFFLALTQHQKRGLEDGVDESQRPSDTKKRKPKS